MKKKFGEYFIGFDIGTNSVGWAVTDSSYKILKFNGKCMWGTHLFEDGVSAQDRRMYRCARRRTERVAQRLELLREFFRPAINDVDPAFFQRLADSKYYAEDKQIDQKNTLFADSTFDDTTYHGTYPTIYHLRQSLVHERKAHDVRLVYLALHHIIKHRGHFLFEGQDFETVTSFDHVFAELIMTLADYEIQFDDIDSAGVEQALKNDRLGITAKKKELAKFLASKDKQCRAIADLLAGGKVDLAKIFEDETLLDVEVKSISLSNGIDDQMDTLAGILDDRLYLISKLKAVYDWSVLVNILQGSAYLCDAKVTIYETHKADLKTLKAMCKQHLNKEDKVEVLNDETHKTNYYAYSGHGGNCAQKDFCDYLKKKFAKVETKDENQLDAMARMELGTFMPRQVSKDNGVIPNQLHLQECREILSHAKAYVSVLNDTDEKGLSVSDKILSILTFRIPYYVGPLNPYGEHAWIEKKSKEKIYPWNFDDVVDKTKSAEGFILRMTNKCTYLPKADVLPKQSVLYSKYNILNQLNNLRVNGEKLKVETKQQMFDHLFQNPEKVAKVTFKRIKDFLIASGTCEKGSEIELSGLDNGVEGDLKPYVQFNGICGVGTLSVTEMDEIIQKITILGDSKDLLRDYLEQQYRNVLNSDQIKKISRLRYTGWGRFSREFLEDIYHADPDTGECKSIVTMLYDTQDNLMQLLTSQYTFVQSMEAFNAQDEEMGSLNSNVLKDLYVSPAVRRSIWRVMAIAKELTKIAGHPPKKIFVEMARDTQDSKKPKKATSSRKNQLLELYKACEVQNLELMDQLERADDGELRDNRLFLYYSQMGRCAYSGEPISLSDINTLYDVDHIYPQSRVKDDSTHANKVLVKRTLNAIKSDQYPIPENCLGKDVHKLWFTLRKNNLMSQEKYDRLSRRTGFTMDELSGFIARQLVETRQSSKAAAELLQKFHPDSEVVYVKAGNVSEFRKQNELFKSRLVNDYHHAKDAYLNIVVGNVYHEKFTKNPIHFLKKNPIYSMNKIFDYPVVKGDTVIWESKENQSLNLVKNQVARNNILFTRYATTYSGGFFNQMPVSAGKGQHPLKTSDQKLSNIERYGAYNSVSSAYYFLVEHQVKGKTVRTIEYVPVVKVKDVNTKEDLHQYCLDSGFIEPRILIRKIKINTLFKVNGFNMHLSGRTNAQLTCKAAMPLVLSPERYEYARKIEKYVEKNKEQKTVLPISKEHQKITKEENLVLYDALTDKLENTIYKVKLSSQISTFKDGKDIFESLTLPQQCELLYNAFTLFSTAPAATDLTLIGGSKRAGLILMSNNPENADQISIIHQSVTGLFQQEIDLKSL